MVVWLTLLTDSGLHCKPHNWYILHGRNRLDVDESLALRWFFLFPVALFLFQRGLGTLRSILVYV